MNDSQLYLQIALWSQIVSSIVFIGVLVYMWFEWLMPVVLDGAGAQQRADRRGRAASRRGQRRTLDVLRSGDRDGAPRRDADQATRAATRRAARARRFWSRRRPRPASGPWPTPGESSERARAAARHRLRDEMLERGARRSRARMPRARRPRTRRASSSIASPSRWSAPRMVNQTLGAPLRDRRCAARTASRMPSTRVSADLAKYAAASIGEPGPGPRFLRVAGRRPPPPKSACWRKRLKAKFIAIALHALLLAVRKRREALLQRDRRGVSALERAGARRETLTITVGATACREPSCTRWSRSSKRSYGKKFEVTESSIRD